MTYRKPVGLFDAMPTSVGVFHVSCTIMTQRQLIDGSFSGGSNRPLN